MIYFYMWYLYIRTHLRFTWKFLRPTINAVFNSEENDQEIIQINQCAILKSFGKVGDRIIQNATIFYFFSYIWLD